MVTSVEGQPGQDTHIDGTPPKTDTPTTPADPTVAMPPTERLLCSLEALRSSEVLDGAGEPRGNIRSPGPPRTTPQRAATGSTEIIEQAKGALILRYGTNADHAFDVLLRWSQDTDIDVGTVADNLVTAVRQGRLGPRHDPTLVRWLEEQLSRHHDEPTSD